MTIKALLFDMGNVLIEISFLKMMRSFGMEFPSEGAAAAFVESWTFHDQYERGNISTAEFMREANRVIGKNLAPAEFQKSWNDIYVGEVTGMAELLKDIKNHIPIYLLSNTNPIHMDYCKQNFHVLDHFNHLFLSYELRSRKPESEIFKQVLQHVDLDPHEILFFDDLPRNVENAKNFGMSAEIAFQSRATIEQGMAKYHITNLRP